MSYWGGDRPYATNTRYNLQLSDDKIQLNTGQGSTEFLLSDLLEKLLNIPEILSVGESRMSLRSFLGNLFFAQQNAAAVVEDLSANKLPALRQQITDLSGVDAVILASQAAAEARLAAEEAGTAAQALKDAAQDATQTANSLADQAVAASVAAASAAIEDLSGNIRGRVAALEGAPGFDASAILASISSLEAADVTASARLDAVESHNTSDAARLDAVEAAVVTKVASVDFGVYTAATDAAVGALQSGKADVSYVDAEVATKEDIGKVTKIDAAGFNEANWNLAAIKAALKEGRLVELVRTVDDEAFLLDLYPVTDGDCFRIRNTGAVKFRANMGNLEMPSAYFTVFPAETAVIYWNGSEFRYAA
jgi:hypothetical protein